MTTYNVEIVVNGRDNASGPLNRVGGALGNIGQIAAGILTADLFKGLLSGLSDLTREALDSYASFERLGMALQSLSARELLNTGQATNMAQAMGMAQGQAQDLLGWIEKLAIQSPFKQEDVAAAFRLSMAYGFTTKEAQRLTTAMIDFSAGTGASGHSMELISLALGQIKAKGKLAGQEMLQLTNAGLDVRGILAESFGVTTEELVRMQERGLIPANEAIEAIVSTLEKDFGGAAKAQANTFSGLLASLEDIKSVGLREFFEGTFKSVQPYLSLFVNTLTDGNFMDGLSRAGERFGAFIGNALDGVKNLVQLFGYLRDNGLKAFNPLALKNFLGVSDELAEKLTTVAGAVRNIIGLLPNLAASFGGLLAGGGLAAAFGPIGLSLGSSLFGGILSFATGGGALAIGKGIAASLFTTTLLGLSKFSPALGGAFFKMFMVKGSAEKMFGGIGKAFAGIGAKLAPLAKFMAPIANLAGLAAPILLVATAVMTLVGAFSLLQKGQLLPMLAPLPGIFSQIGAAASRIVPVIAAAGTQIWNSLITNSEQLASQVIPWLVEQFQKFADWFSVNEPLIKQFIQTIADFFSNTLIPAIASAWQFIAPLLGGIIDLLLGLATFIMQVVVGDWAGAWETLKATAVSAGQAIGQAIWGFLNWIAGLFGSSMEQIGTTLNQMWAIIAYEWNTGIANISAGLQNWIGGIGTTLAQLGTIIAVSFQQWIASLQTTVTQLFAIIATSIQTWIASLMVTFSQLGMLIMYFLTSIVNSILGFITSFVDAGMQLITGIATGAQDALAGLTGTFMEIGTSIVEGVKQGIEAQWDALVAWFMDLIAQLADAASKALGIHSPSRVFAGIGKNTMAGLAVGIEKNSAAPQAAVVEATGEMIGAGRRRTNQIGKNIQNNRSQTNYFGPVTIVAEDGRNKGRKNQDDLRNMR